MKNEKAPEQIATQKNISFEGIHECRTFQRGKWTFNGDTVCVENTRTPWMKPMLTEYWLQGWQHDSDSLFHALEAHGLDKNKYYAVEEFYGEGVFPATEDLQAAIDYFNATKVN